MTSTAARGLRADAVLAASILVLGVFLLVTGLGLMERWQESAGRRQAPGFDDLLGAAAVVVGLSIVAWWILSILLAASAAAFEKSGKRRAAARTGRCCPAFMRRLAVAALSLQLLSAPLAQATVSPSGPAWVPTQEVAADDAVLAQWAPTAATLPAAGPGITDLPAGTMPSPRPQEPAVPQLGTPGLQPVDAPSAETQTAETRPEARVPAEAVTEGRVPGETLPAAAAAPAVHPEWRPRAPVTDPGLLASQPVREAPGVLAQTRQVTVLAGDTLWDIASRDLGPTATDVDVALQWPRWYEANKAQIGLNPDVLLPGQILKSPSTA